MIIFARVLCLVQGRANLDFDAYDSFDYCADDWEKICNNTFNFFDSLGGNI